jgi:glycosyltransferase involved in cell wall biosynthesis
MTSAIKRVLAFPWAGNIYTEQLYAEVEKQGVTVIEGTWTRRWLAETVRAHDVIHIHWPSFLYHEPRSQIRTYLRLVKLAAHLRFAKRRGATIVWTAHNLYPHEGGRDLAAHRWGRKIVIAFADRVIVHGKSAARALMDEFKIAPSRLRIGHHPHWIDCYANSVTAAESRARLNIGAEEFLYLHIGRCKPYKGLEALISAFRSTPPPARLLIAGKFSSTDYLEEIKAIASRTPNVQVVPHSIPDDELQVYLNAADCVALPYREILTSGTALLAMSFGRPVVAPDLGSMRDHVNEASGILYDAARADGLAQALNEVRTRRFEPSATVEHVRQFTWSDLATLLLQPTP